LGVATRRPGGADAHDGVVDPTVTQFSTRTDELARRLMLLHEQEQARRSLRAPRARRRRLLRLLVRRPAHAS
jgi:hypothetical protein